MIVRHQSSLPREVGFVISPGIAREVLGPWNAKHIPPGYFTGQYFRFLAFKNMFPQMSNPAIRKMIRSYAKTALGWKLSGAGGGGYLVLVSQEPVPGAIQLKIRRPGE